jgi:hypothetical protein
VEQAGAQLLLELGDLVAERRLDDEATFGSASEVAQLGDRHDVAELLKVHTTIVFVHESRDNYALDRFFDSAREYPHAPPDDIRRIGSGHPSRIKYAEGES